MIQKYILKNSNVQFKEKSNVLVVIHFYYADRIKKYFKYIKEIPKEVDVIFTYSNYEVYDILDRTFPYIKKIKAINRGRDVSALLVAAKPEILKYSLFCFLHDKKEKVIEEKKETEEWIESLWGNLLGHVSVINQIVNLFNENDNLGLVLPPVFLGKQFSLAVSNLWYDTYKDVCILLEKIQLNSFTLNENEQPIAIGTMFWARTKALKKLFDIEWRYEHFNEEPRKDDEEHLTFAIERCFNYVVEDAGYNTGIVMTEEYAIKSMDIMLETLKSVYAWTNKSYFTNSLEEIQLLANKKNNMAQFIKKFPIKYIYGAGRIGKSCMNVLHTHRIQITGFIVTECHKDCLMLDGIQIKEFRDVILDEDVGIIIAAGKSFCKEIRNNIKSSYPDFENIFEFTKLKDAFGEI